MNGEGDDIVVPVVADALDAAAGDDAEVVRYPGGHVPTDADLDVVRPALVEFLAQSLTP